MSERYRYLNTPAPQVVLAGTASAVLGCSDVHVHVTDDCFILVSAAGTIPTSADGHFRPAGSSVTLTQLDAAHKVGVSAGTATVYISAVG